MRRPGSSVGDRVVTVLLGLSGALVYGSADFFGGLAAKRISAMRVTAIGGASGLLILIALLPLVPSSWSTEAVLLGALSGVSGAAAVALLYGCLAIGPMSILSPLTAVISAVVPLLAGLLRGERLSALGYVALGVALVAVVLVGFVPDRAAVRPSGRALAMATGSGVLIGVFLIVIDLTPADSGLVPLVANRTVNTAIMFSVIGVLALVARARGRGIRSDTGARWRPGFLLAAVAGMVDASANVLLLLGLRTGDLSIVSVLTAMYPAGTIILAAVVLRERITPTQVVGLVLALTAAAMLALA